MRDSWRELPLALARLPLIAKLLLAFVSAGLVVFLTQTQPSGGRGSSPPDKSFHSTDVPPPAEPMPLNLEAKTEDTLRQPPIPEVVRLERPEVQFNGTIKNGNSYFVLSDITSFGRKDVCSRSSGQKWACGLQAYATLHNMVAGHAIDCVPRQTEGNNTVASCRLGPQNIAAELLKKGLVKLRPEASDLELQKAQNYAQSRRVGVWE